MSGIGRTSLRKSSRVNYKKLHEGDLCDLEDIPEDVPLNFLRLSDQSQQSDEDLELLGAVGGF